MEAVGLLTVVSGLQQIVTAALDERRKAAEAKRAQRRDTMTRERIQIGTRAGAEALTDKEIDRLTRQNERLAKENEEQQATIDQQAGEILHQRGEITNLFRELYKLDPRYRQGP